MILGMLGMTILIIGYWIDGTYTYDHGKYLIAASMAPGLVVGMISAISVEITGLPVLVGAYNGFGGLAAALEVRVLLYSAQHCTLLCIFVLLCSQSF